MNTSEEAAICDACRKTGFGGEIAIFSCPVLLFNKDYGKLQKCL